MEDNSNDKFRYKPKGDSSTLDKENYDNSRKGTSKGKSCNSKDSK